MKNNSSRIVSLAVGALVAVVPFQQAKAAVLASYDFSAANGNSSVTEPGSVPGAFIPVNFPSSSGYSAGAVFGTANDMQTTPGTAYFSFTISPATGTDRLNLAGTGALTFDTIRGTSLSVFNWVLRTSVDGFTTDVASGTTPTVSALNPQSVDLSSVFNAQDAPVEFRFYTSDGGENGNSANLRGSFDNVVLNGTISVVPEPINVALAVFGLCVAGAGVGRRLYRRTRA